MEPGCEEAHSPSVGELILSSDWRCDKYAMQLGSPAVRKELALVFVSMQKSNKCMIRQHVELAARVKTDAI